MLTQFLLGYVSVPGAALNIHTVTSAANSVRSSVESLSGKTFIKSKNKLIPVNAQPGLRSLTLVPTTVALSEIAKHASHPTTPPVSDGGRNARVGIECMDRR